jgi:hypothetical protein
LHSKTSSVIFFFLNLKEIFLRFTLFTFPFFVFLRRFHEVKRRREV